MEAEAERTWHAAQCWRFCITNQPRRREVQTEGERKGEDDRVNENITIKAGQH